MAASMRSIVKALPSATRWKKFGSESARTLVVESFRLVARPYSWATPSRKPDKALDIVVTAPPAEAGGFPDFNMIGLLQQGLRN
jgi:hypothetical protein